MLAYYARSRLPPPADLPRWRGERHGLAARHSSPRPGRQRRRSPNDARLHHRRTGIAVTPAGHIVEGVGSSTYAPFRLNPPGGLTARAARTPLSRLTSFSNHVRRSNLQGSWREPRPVILP